MAGLLGAAALGLLCSIGIRPSSSAGEGQGAGEEMAKVEVPARSPEGREWVDTGIRVSKDEALTLRATGYTSYYATAGFFSADGATTPVASRWGPREGRLDPNAPPGALVGKIGDEGDPFLVGKQRTVQAPSSGTLFLGFNDAVGHAGDNFGTFTVAVYRGEDKASSKTAEVERPPESPRLSIRPELIGTERWIPRGFEYLYPELEKGPFVLKGRVTAPDGSPAGGVRIVAFRGEAWEWGAAETKSAQDGSYELRNLPDGPYFMTAIAADAFGFKRFAFHDQLMTGNELHLDVAMQPYGPEMTSGRVVTMEGEPVPDALVLSIYGWGCYGISLAVQTRTDGHGRTRTDTDAHGRFVIPQLTGHEAVHAPLVAFAEGRGPGLLRDVRRGESDNVIVLGDGVRLAGAVRFKDSGNPAAGIPVTLSQTPMDDDLPNIVTKTDEDGTFVFERLCPFPYRMTIDAPESGLTANEFPTIVLHGGRDKVGLEFMVSPGATIAGTVTTSDTSEPLSGVKVWTPAFRGSKPFRKAVTSPDGRYELRHLPGGEFTVECETPTSGVMMKVRNDMGGGRNLQRVKLAPDSATSGVDFHFERGATVSGRVTDKDGRPVAGARLSGNNWERRGRPGEVFRLPEVATAADGTYRLPGLGKGHTWAITVSADGFARAVSDAIQTDEDISGKNFVLTKAARLSGRVVDEDGRRVPFCLVQLRLFGPPGIPAGPEAVFSDEEGRFAFREGVLPGVYLFDLYPFGFGFESYQHGLANNAPLKITGTQDVAGIEVIIPGGADARKKSDDKPDDTVVGEIKDGVHIKAFIDGSDTIKIQGNKLWYVHHTWDLPGKWGNEGREAKDDKPTYVNGVKWYPEWIGIETDGQSYSPEWHEKASEPCQIVGAALPRDTNDRIRLRKLQGGGLAAIADTPKPANDYTLSILLDDNLRGGGAEWYEVIVDWSAPPAPKESVKETARDDAAATGAKVLPPKPRTDRHLGVWKTVDGDELDVTMTFEKTTVQLAVLDIKMSGPYQMDYTKTPIWLDVQVPDMGNLRCVIAFEGDDTLWMTPLLAGDEPRPTRFDGGGEGVRTFRRVKADPEKRPAQEAVALPREAGKVLAFDDFEDVLSLEWEILHEDRAHYSLEKNRGTLTVTTQDGHFKEGHSDYKNVLLIDSPVAEGQDFLITTCLNSFRPREENNQAGLLCWDDEDNYVEWVYEYCGIRGPAFCVGSEVGGPARYHVYGTDEHLGKLWLRLTKRGNSYAYSWSVDGKTFEDQGVVEWGDGSPKRVGLFALNGTLHRGVEIDASFEFFEVRALMEE